jgi:hypothetical protein
MTTGVLERAEELDVPAPPPPSEFDTTGANP